METMIRVRMGTAQEKVAVEEVMVGTEREAVVEAGGEEGEEGTAVAAVALAAEDRAGVGEEGEEEVVVVRAELRAERIEAQRGEQPGVEQREDEVEELLLLDGDRTPTPKMVRPLPFLSPEPSRSFAACAEDDFQDPPNGGATIPSCNCDEPAVEKTVMKESANKGRKFFACSKGQDGGCGYFLWLGEAGGGGRGGRVVPQKRPLGNVSLVSLWGLFAELRFLLAATAATTTAAKSTTSERARRRRRTTLQVRLDPGAEDGHKRRFVLGVRRAFPHR